MGRMAALSLWSSSTNRETRYDVTNWRAICQVVCDKTRTGRVRGGAVAGRDVGVEVAAALDEVRVWCTDDGTLHVDGLGDAAREAGVTERWIADRVRPAVAAALE